MDKKDVEITAGVRYSDPLILYFTGYEKCDPSHSFGPAIRTHYLIHYVVKGSGRFHENGRVHSLHAGDLFLILPGQITYYEADRETPWEYCWIGFDGYEAASILKSCGLWEEQPVRTSAGLKLEAVLFELHRRNQAGEGNSYAYTGLLYEFFSHLLAEGGTEKKPASREYLKKALEYIHHNYVYDIHITDIAEHVGVDRTYLYRLFCAEKNLSPKQYLIRYRLHIAARLLKETDYTVTEIAYSCGFGDAPSFSRHFHSRFRMTPTAYRRQKEDPMLLSANRQSGQAQTNL